MPAVQAVEGTDAARAEQLRRTAPKRPGERPHILLDPDPATRAKAPKRGVITGMSAREHADRIVAHLLRGSGPILLVVPGTVADLYDNTMGATARAFIRRARGPVSVSSIPYPNGVLDIAKRFLDVGIDPDDNVLALVLRSLVRANTGRPILVSGESQGAWLVADTLRAEPALAAALTRVGLVSKPEFAKLPDAVGAARQGAGLLPASAAGAGSVLEWRHTDDIVAALFERLHVGVLRGYADGLSSLLGGGAFRYAPHHYETHAEDIAAWLLDGVRAGNLVHHSSEDAPAPELDLYH